MPGNPSSARHWNSKPLFILEEVSYCYIQKLYRYTLIGVGVTADIDNFAICYILQIA